MGWSTVADDTVSQKEFAELIGVAARTVFNLREAGLSDHCEVRGNSVRVRIPEGIQWYVRHKETEAASRERPSSIEAVELEIARLRLEEKAHDVGKKKGQLIEVAKIEPWVGDMMARIASRLTALPLRIAQTVNAKTLRERRVQAEALVAEVRDEIRLAPLGEESEDVA